MSVTGKRRPFYESYLEGSWSTAALEIGSPVLIGVAGWWLVHVARKGHPFSGDHIGTTVVGSAVFGVIGLVGLIGLWMLFRAFHTVVLDSPCPVCGVERRRNFFDPQKADAEPAACGACLAYLRTNAKHEVSEEKIEMVQRVNPPYILAPKSYLAIAKRDRKHHLEFEMPAMCAICGNKNAPLRRAIGGKLASSDLGALGAAAAMATDLIANDAGVKYSQHNAPGTSVPRGADLDRELVHLTVPVCAAHTESADAFGNALQYTDGALRFASYRYYRAFCEANQVPMLKSVASTTGAPSASSPQ